MKDFDVIKAAEVIQHVQKEVNKHTDFLGTAKLQPGQFLWELNTKTLEVEKCAIDYVSVHYSGQLTKTVYAKEGYLYCIAINKENALRKFIKICNKITHGINSRRI